MDGPYREAKPLTDLIPPDRRRQKTIAIVLASMVAGIVLWKVSGAVYRDLADNELELAHSPSLDPPRLPHHPQPVAEPEGDPGAANQALDATDVEAVVSRHRAAVMHACWDEHSPNLQNADVNTTIIVGVSGRVVSARATGTDAVVASCVEEQVRTWQFPVRSTRSETIRIPFKFARQ